MARKSRNIVNSQGTQIHNFDEKRYTVAVYARKSLDDEESLDIQIRMLLDYIDDSEDLILYKVFSDNACTGTNFDRPSFKQMIEEMELGKFNTILVKDGSRLGRNYLEAGAYMEKIFPSYQIRFISVNDRYDSNKEDFKSDGISIPLKNIMNEQYSKDLSRKLSPAFRVRQMEGKFIGGLTTYGYLKDKDDKNKLVIDYDVAPVIRNIFMDKVRGVSDGEIAKQLNEREVLSPFAYRFEKGLVRAAKYKNMPWKRGTIASIISNPIYTGNMVQGRTRQSLSMHEKQHKTPPNEWIIVENTHEAIIEPELFEQVQDIVKNRKVKYHSLQNPSNNVCENLFRGRIYCADCGRAMELTKSVSTVSINRYYRCKLYNETGGQECSRKTVRQEKMEAVVLSVLKNQIRWYCNMEDTIKTMNLSAGVKDKLRQYQSEITRLEMERQKNISLAGGLNEDYQNKILDEEEYCFLKSEYNCKIKQLTNEIDRLDEIKKSYRADYTANKKLSDKARKYLDSDTLSKEMVEAFISRIEVYDDSHIIVKINCRDEVKRMSELARERGVKLDAYRE